MFSTLDEQIESTESTHASKSDRLVRFLIILLVSALVFGGLLLAVWHVG